MRNEELHYEARLSWCSGVDENRLMKYSAYICLLISLFAPRSLSIHHSSKCPLLAVKDSGNPTPNPCNPKAS